MEPKEPQEENRQDPNKKENKDNEPAPVPANRQPLPTTPTPEMERTGEGLATLVKAALSQTTRLPWYKRLAEILNSLRSIVVSLAVVIGVIGLLLLAYVYLRSETAQSVILVDPFEVDAELQKKGLSPEYVAKRFIDQVHQIYSQANAGEPQEEYSPSWLQGNVEIVTPQVRFSVQSAMQIVKNRLGCYRARIGGALMEEDGKLKLTVRLHMPTSDPELPTQRFSGIISSQTKDLDETLLDGARLIVGALDPATEAQYEFTEREYGIAVLMIKKCLEESGQQHRGWAYNLWGLCLENLGLDEEAVHKFQAALETNPPFLGAYNNWALVLGKQGQHESALEIYQQACDKDCADAIEYRNWARLLAKMGRHAEAAEKFQLAVDADPGDAYSYEAWGDWLAQREMTAEAVAKYRKAIELSPGEAQLYAAWGKLLLREHRYDLAVARLKRAIKLAPRNAELHAHCALALAGKEAYEEALERIDIALGKNPTHPYVYYIWAGILWAKGNNTEAIQKIKKAIELYPQYTAAYSRWGRILCNMEKYGEARDKFQKAVECDPENAVGHCDLGTLLCKLGDSKQAEVQFRRAIGIDENDAVAHASLGALLAVRKDFEAAAFHYQRAVQSYSEEEHGWRLGWGYYSFWLAWPKKSDDFFHFSAASVFFKRAEQLESQKRWDEAKAMFGKAIESNPEGEIGAKAKKRLQRLAEKKN